MQYAVSFGTKSKHAPYVIHGCQTPSVRLSVCPPVRPTDWLVSAGTLARGPVSAHQPNCQSR